MKMKLAGLAWRSILSILTGAVALGLWISLGFVHQGRTWTAALLFGVAALVWGIVVPATWWQSVIGICLGMWLPTALLGGAFMGTQALFLLIPWVVLWAVLGSVIGRARRKKNVAQGNES